jgi:uncharacterized protein YggE
VKFYKDAKSIHAGMSVSALTVVTVAMAAAVIIAAALVSSPITTTLQQRAYAQAPSSTPAPTIEEDQPALGSLPSDNGTITVTATSTSMETPDTAVLQILVVERGATGEQALAAADRGIQRIIQAFKGANVTSDEITANLTSVQPEYEFSFTSNDRVLKGYIANRGVEITTSDLEKAPKLADAAIRTNPQAVTVLEYQFSRELSQQIQTRMINDATAMARQSAEEIAASQGLSLKGIQKIQVAVSDDTATPGAFGTVQTYKSTILVPTQVIMTVAVTYSVT